MKHRKRGTHILVLRELLIRPEHPPQVNSQYAALFARPGVVDPVDELRERLRRRQLAHFHGVEYGSRFVHCPCHCLCIGLRLTMIRWSLVCLDS